MSMIGFSRLSLRVGIAVIVVGGTPVARAAPNACALVTVAEVSTAIGRPVSGGTISVVDNPRSVTSNCPYKAGSLMINVMVSELPTAAAAQKQFAEDLKNSRNHDDENQKTTVEAGVGEGAYMATGGDGVMVEFKVVGGSRIIDIGIIGQGAATVSRDRLRALILTALSR